MAKGHENANSEEENSRRQVNEQEVSSSDGAVEAAIAEEPQTIEMLAEILTDDPTYAAGASDDTLLEILKNVFGANWFFTKDVLTMDKWPGTVANKPPHENSIALMQAMVDMRGRKWTAFATNTVPKIEAEVAAKKAQNNKLTAAKNPTNETGKNLAIGDPAGSQSVTSDLDLSLKGENTEIGVALLNREFRTFFGVACEPGAMFDINVYSSDWMFGGDQVAREATVATYVPKEEEVLSQQGKKKKDDQNEVWSLVKIRRNMHNVAEWTAYKTDVLQQLTSNEELQEMRKKFATVDLEFAAFHKSVQDLVVQMNGAALNEMDHYQKDAATMAASNRLYEEKITRVKEIRVAIQQLKDANAPADQIEAMAIELHNEISRGLTYANEVYATQGAVLHTVYGKQGAKKKLAKIQSGGEAVDTAKAGVAKGADVTAVKYELSPELYLQSVNENVGDTLHSLEHYADDPQYAVYRAGKYLDRLCEAVEQLVTLEVAQKLKGYTALKEIGVKSVEEKDKEAGKDPMAVKGANSYFSKFKASDLSGVKASALGLGAAATITHKNKQKAN